MAPVPTHRHAGLPVIAAVTFLGALLGSSPGWGYRFYRSFDDDSRAPRSDEARRWSEAVWGPRDTLVWHVLDDPLWQPHFSGAEELLPSVEESLDTWTRVSSADVRWRVDGILAGAQVGLDDRNTVSVEETEDFAGQARGWSLRRGDGPWERIECDVVLSTDYLERLAGTNDNRLSTLLHEFGHCLGLQHAATTPTVRWDWAWTGSSVWQKDPHMSYGWDIDGDLAEDEVIGASLLRPVSGWQRTWGSLSGTVTLAGQPARFVSVDILRNEGGRARPAVQVFTDEDGGFLVEGLAPGEYVVWIHQMFRHDAHTALLSAGAVTDARDLLLPRRHRVRAGQETPAGEFTLLRGRDQR